MLTTIHAIETDLIQIEAEPTGIERRLAVLPPPGGCHKAEGALHPFVRSGQMQKQVAIVQSEHIQIIGFVELTRFQ